MDRWLSENLVCPRDHSHLELGDHSLSCALGHTYPYVDGIPILLLNDVRPTIRYCWRVVEQIGSRQASGRLEEEAGGEEGVDSYVQHAVAATCGRMYKSLVNKLASYPIPELPLPEASGGSVFLDLGCSWGRWCVSAARKGYTAVGIDPSFQGIKAARRVARQLGVSATYVVADARYLPFPAAAFNVVFSYSVLQHFSRDDVELALGEVARTLRPGGISMIQMPNILGARNVYNHVIKKRFVRPTGFDVQYWSVSDLRDTFSDLIGPTRLLVDGFFALGAGASDGGLLPLRYRLAVSCSEWLRRMTDRIEWMKYFADSLWVKSVRAGACRGEQAK